MPKCYFEKLRIEEESKQRVSKSVRLKYKVHKHKDTFQIEKGYEFLSRKSVFIILMFVANNGVISRVMSFDVHNFSDNGQRDHMYM